MDFKYYMYKVFLVPGKIDQKIEWDGNTDTLKQNNLNMLVILNRMLEKTYYPTGKDDTTRYMIFPSATAIKSLSHLYSKNPLATYNNLDINDFIIRNKNRFYRNRTNGIVYFNAEPASDQLKSPDWFATRDYSIGKGYLVCCHDLADFNPLYSAGGAKKSRRRIKKLRSRRIYW